jgi:lipoprotein-anchoring transpeptidase ErfK/SrfK
MRKHLNRREFLKLAGLTTLAGGLSAFNVIPAQAGQSIFAPDFARPSEWDHGLIGRIGAKQVDLRAAPNDTSPIVGNRFRDQLIHIYAEVRPPDAPAFYNTLWYRVWGGYIHSAHIQIVRARLNTPAGDISEAGQLSEITVPYTTAYQYSAQAGWQPWRGSKLYYESTHWITAVEVGPDGQPWYKITSELSKTENYFAPAAHLRLIQPAELAPISPDVSADRKHIEVSLNEQTVRFYEDERVVHTARVSTGIPNKRLAPEELQTDTPKGDFRILSKYPSKHMGSLAGGAEVEDRGQFTLPGVPWTSFFHPDGYAFHGTYWHNNFGLQMSHGCINMRNADALFLFRWATPYFQIKDGSYEAWYTPGYGVVVKIF